MAPTVVSPRVANERRCLLGESPRWDPDGARVAWIDILAGQVHLHPLTGGPTRSLTVGGRVGGLLLRAGGAGYVVGQERSVRLLDPDGRVEATLVEEVPGDGRGLRINECAVDPAGRLVFGVMTGDKEPGTGALWRRERSGDLRLLRQDLTISNGMGWTADGRYLYHVDSPTHRVVRLPYGDDGCGEPEVVATVEEDAGVPDGLCVDAEDGFWVAVNGGGQCRHFSATGAETHRVELPAKATASCVLVDGGGDPQLFVTSGCSGMTEADLLEEPAAGYLFSADVPQAPAPPTFYPG